MRRSFKTALSAIIIALSAVSAFAALNYSGMSTVELAELRGKLQNETVENREAFRKEWQKRVIDMTPEEKAKYVGTAADGNTPKAKSNDPNCQ